MSNGIVYILSEPYEEREVQARDGTTGDLLWAAKMPYTKLARWLSAAMSTS